eukprot:1114168_1
MPSCCNSSDSSFQIGLITIFRVMIIELCIEWNYPHIIGRCLFGCFIITYWSNKDNQPSHHAMVYDNVLCIISTVYSVIWHFGGIRRSSFAFHCFDPRADFGQRHSFPIDHFWSYAWYGWVFIISKSYCDDLQLTAAFKVQRLPHPVVVSTTDHSDIGYLV